MQYKPNDRFDAGVTWVYATGNTATLAMQQIGIEGMYGAVNFVESRNNFRLPSYHRLDLSVNFHKKKRYGIRTWNISIYNAYNQQNPFIIYPKQIERWDSQGVEYSTVLMQRSLFPIIPSVSYIYKF